MTMTTARLTVRGLMIVVGLIGVLLGSFRFHFSVGSFVSGVVAIAAIRTSGKIAKLHSTGRPIRDVDRVMTFGKSFVTASVLLSASSMPVVLLFKCYDPNLSY